MVFDDGDGDDDDGEICEKLKLTMRSAIITLVTLRNMFFLIFAGPLVITCHHGRQPMLCLS